MGYEAGMSMKIAVTAVVVMGLGFVGMQTVARAAEPAPMIPTRIGTASSRRRPG